MADDTSDDWSPESVRLKLRRAARNDCVSAEVFFRDGVEPDDLYRTAEAALGEAARRLGRPATATVGRVHRLARSVSVSGDPDVIAELSAAPAVKTLLPSEIQDILPRPFNIRPVK